jgi:hypothetical protein
MRALFFWISLACPALAWNLPDLEKSFHPASVVSPADPRTYPDKEGFAQRREKLVSALATNDLSKWRRGYFKGGDPGKYLPCAAMARLLIDPNDSQSREFMNDDRSPREHYHFAAINWARFLPIFGDALTPATRGTLAAEAAKYSAYLNPSGTENHRTMNLFASNVLPDYLDSDRFAGKAREDAMREAKEKLRIYVKNLYAVGQGEWDSPTYLMFSLHGLLNIYDFTRDPETRLIAAAGLDWLTAAYALKYRDGLFTGPNQRGYYDRAMASIADQTGWLWWGSKAQPKNPASFLYAIHAATSSWRPNRVLTNLARKDVVGLPAEQKNTKPNYYFGQQIEPVAGTYPETLYLSASFTMGTLWAGFGSQITRFHLVANSNEGPLALTGGHPRKSDHKLVKLDELTFRDGGGRYDQTAQLGPLHVCLSRIPDDEVIDYTFVSLPTDSDPKQIAGRWFFRMGEAWVAVIPFTNQSEIAPVPLSDKEAAERVKQKDPTPHPRMLRISGRPSGFAVIAAEESDFPDVHSFAKWTETAYKFDTSKFAGETTIGITLPDRRNLTLRHDPSSRTIAGLDAPTGDVYSGPFVRQRGGRLEVSDGREGYAIDFTGDVPVYLDLEHAKQP